MGSSAIGLIQSPKRFLHSNVGDLLNKLEYR